MSTPLTLAVEAISDRFGSQIAESLDRVQLQRNHSLVLEGQREDGQSCWYRFKRNTITELHPLRDNKLPIFNTPAPLREASVQILTWRPGKRVVFKEHRAQVKIPITKAFRKGRSMEAMYRHSIAQKATEKFGFDTAEIQHWDNETDALHFTQLPGVPLDLSEQSTDHAFRIGALLKAFQQATPANKLQPHTSADEIKVIEEAMRRRKAIDGPPKADSVQLLDHLQSLQSKLAPTRKLLCHRDLHDGQFLVGARNIALLDFDLLCLADPALDVANLLAHFCLRSLQAKHGASVPSTRSLGDALLEGLDYSAGDFWQRIRFYQACSFLRLAQIYAVRPRWRWLSPQLLRFAQRCTSEIHAI